MHLPMRDAIDPSREQSRGENRFGEILQRIRFSHFKRSHRSRQDDGHTQILDRRRNQLTGVAQRVRPVQDYDSFEVVARVLRKSLPHGLDDFQSIFDSDLQTIFRHQFRDMHREIFQPQFREHSGNNGTLIDQGPVGLVVKFLDGAAGRDDFELVHEILGGRKNRIP